MDPKACLKRFCDAAEDGNLDEMHLVAGEYNDWTADGGFLARLPDGTEVLNLPEGPWLARNLADVKPPLAKMTGAQVVAAFVGDGSPSDDHPSWRALAVIDGEVFDRTKNQHAMAQKHAATARDLADGGPITPERLNDLRAGERAMRHQAAVIKALRDVRIKIMDFSG